MTEKILCGVDLGGTKLSVGALAPDGAVKSERKVTDHVHLDNDEMVIRIADLVTELLETEEIEAGDLPGIGIGMAGHVNSREGLVITTSNFEIPFRKFPLRDRLEKRLNLPVMLENDANAQAFGEFVFGAGRGKDSMVFMTVSTGVGAGIILDGKILRGCSGSAGEVGHTIIDPGSRIRCTCGNFGCLTAFRSTLGLADRYRFWVEDGMKAGLTPEEVDNLDGLALERAVGAGDEISLRLFQESADNIGIGIYNIDQIINPQAVILGGGLMNMRYGFLDRIREKFESLAQHMVYEKLEISLTELGPRAGLLGAAALTLESR